MATALLQYRQLSLSLKYRSVLFPFEPLQFIHILSRNSFIPTDIPPTVPLGMRADVNGVVARKGDVGIRMDTGRLILAVHGTDPKTCVTEMEALDDLIQEEFGLENPREAQYYELLAGVAMKAQTSPLASWQKRGNEFPFANKAAAIIGWDVAPFGVRLCPKENIPNDPDWFDIRVEPLVQSATRQHSVEIVFRRAKRDEVFAFVSALDSTITRLLALVEEG